jgi:hypothetical protein
MAFLSMIYITDSKVDSKALRLQTNHGIKIDVNFSFMKHRQKLRLVLFFCVSFSSLWKKSFQKPPKQESKLSAIVICLPARPCDALAACVEVEKTCCWFLFTVASIDIYYDAAARKSHRNLRSRTSMLAQVLQIFFWGEEHLVKNRLISTLDKVINFKETIFLRSTKPLFTSRNRVEIS